MAGFIEIELSCIGIIVLRERYPRIDSLTAHPQIELCRHLCLLIECSQFLVVRQLRTVGFGGQTPKAQVQVVV